MVRPTTVAVALGLGSAGALTDVSSYLESEDSIEYQWGRQDGFEPVRPGEFAFTLNNSDGRFTPDNPVSPYTTTLTEGMAVTWQLNSRIIAGTVRDVQPEFPSGESAWARVRVICDDFLGDMARKSVGNLVERLYGDKHHWPLDEAEGALAGSDRGKNPYGPFVPRGTAGAVQFGSELAPYYSNSTAAAVNVETDDDAPRGYLECTGPFTVTSGAFDIWVTPTRPSNALPRIAELIFDDFLPVSYRMGRLSTAVTDKLYVGTDVYDLGYNLPLNVPTYVGITVGVGFRYVQIHINGTLILQTPIYGGYPITLGLSSIRLSQDKVGAGYAHASLEYAGPAYGAAAGAGELLTDRLADLADLMPLSLTTEAGFSTELVGSQTTDNASFLEVFTEAMAVEAGVFWAKTTGTLTAPVSTVNIRPRVLARPTTSKYTLDVEADLQGAPDLIRNLKNKVAIVDAKSATDEIRVTDQTIFNAIGDVSDDMYIPAYTASTLRNVAEDRIRRGNVSGLRVEKVTVDALNTSTDRWADLIGTVPGDRITISGLPGTQLGFTTWDGIFVGGEEEHTETSHLFSLYLEPALPKAVFNTDRFMGGTDLTLAANITAVATTMSVNTAGATITTSGADLPFKMIVDREIVNVTAVTAATPQVLTITRAQNGTVAAAHNVSAQVEVSPSSVFEF